MNKGCPARQRQSRSTKSTIRGSEVARPSAAGRAVNFGFRDRRMTLQKIELATFVGLADMGAKHRAVAARIARRRRFPGVARRASSSAPTCK